MKDRFTQVQAVLEPTGLDALIVVAPPNLAYVSGLRVQPHERLIALVVPCERKPRLVCPSLEEEAARIALKGRADLHVWRDEDGPGDALASALAGVGVRLGIEKAHLSVANAELAGAAAPGAKFTGCDGLLAELRAVKSEEEIASIRRAAAIVDRVVADLATAATPGTTEAELAAVCVQRLRAEGGEAPAFEPLILTGPRSALPHGHSEAIPLGDGDLLIVDIGATVEGYSADITRTFVVGSEPDERQRAVFETVHAAKRAGVAAAKVGAAACEVDAAARGVIEDAGYGPNFVHRTGHGLGLEVHEPPYLTGTNDEPLRPGMVVTVEPGIYIEGWGGIRIEDDVVIREGAAEVLTTAPVALSPREELE